MFTQDSTQLKQLLDLDARHDDLLRQLEELDRRVLEVLRECSGPQQPQADAACSGSVTPGVPGPLPKAA